MPLDVVDLRARLLRWFRAAHRPMPWRAAPGAAANPYHVMVSEAMLQQTQVATVIDYFHRFISALPTVDALAAAEEQQVLRLWQGLGYYRRARHLHAAARRIVADHAGQIPDTVEALLELPGVGRYTAGAIASIAFARPAPIVDGNVARVISRLTALASPIQQPAVRDRLWQLAAEWVPQPKLETRNSKPETHFNDPGDFNQAMMELGATVCTPRSPRCAECPLADLCAAHRRGEPEAYPVAEKRKRPKAVTHHIVAVSRGDELLVTRRGDDGLWAGMWQQPTFEEVDAADLAAALRDSHGVTVTAPVPAGHFQHLTTHRRIRFELWRARAVSGRVKRGEWRREESLGDLPLPNPQLKALKMLRER